MLLCNDFFFFWPYHATCGMLVPDQGLNPCPLVVEAQSLNLCTARDLTGKNILNIINIKRDEGFFSSQKI